MDDRRLFSAACERNRGPILEVLREALPTEGKVLEIASGTGMHAVYFAQHLPALVWQPSDHDAVALESVKAWRTEAPAENLEAPIRLDVRESPWPIARADAIFNANMIHISPYACCEGLFRGASEVLGADAPLILYGPFRVDGAHTAPSNEAFDRSLKARDPSWGIRDLGEVAELADTHGFDLEARLEMPANNLSVVFRRRRALSSG